MGEVKITANVDMKLQFKKKVAQALLSIDLEKIIRETYKRCNPPAVKRGKLICKDAVERWYASYSPFVYHRKDDLYNAYKIKLNGDYTISFQIGYEFMQYDHHQGNEFVYVNSFVEGWHGGSFGTDESGNTRESSYWRWPTPYYTDWDIIPAPRSFSIRDMIIGYWNAYIDGEYTETVENTFRMLVVAELKKKLSRIKK